MKNTVFPHKFWRPFLDCMPQLFFRPQYVWFPVHLRGHLIPLWYETLVVNWQNWLFALFHQSRPVLSPNPIEIPLLQGMMACLCINSVRPSDAIWQFLSWPSLLLVMACCHSVPNHYLNQWWLIVNLTLRNQTSVKFRYEYYCFH